MKAGDKLYCIRGIKNSDDILYTKGKLYTIKIIYTTSYCDQIYIEDNFGKTGTAFYLSIFDRYFITMQEYRKLKLEKLKNV